MKQPELKARIEAAIANVQVRHSGKRLNVELAYVSALRDVLALMRNEWPSGHRHSVTTTAFPKEPA